MDVDSTENRLEGLSGFLKEEESSLTAESDLSFVANKEEYVEGYSYADVARNKELDLSDQGQHSDLRYNEISGSPSENFQSDLQTGFDHDLLLNEARVAVNHHPKEDAEEEFALDLLKSSAHVESQNFHHEMESEAAANLREFPLTNQEEELEDGQTPVSHDKIGDGNLLEMPKHELVKSEFAYKEPEHNEAIREKNSPADSIKLEILHPHQSNLEQTPVESTSPGTQRKMSVSPLMCRSNKDMVASQEKSSIGKDVLPEDHKLGGDIQNAASPQESPCGSRHMNGYSVEHVGASPRNHDSVKKHRRRYVSESHSPIRQRDSSSQHKRDHHHRSRSRSPYRRESRDYYRRSPRRRYSSRRRSPPSGHHAYRRSPKGRHWSPPHNRSTGLGKPGRNLFVAGFSFLTTERDLERKFSRFGRVRDVRIVRDKRSGDSRGFGFLSLERDEEADAAIRALDKTEWHGRIVLVEKSKSH